ncbi:MAG: NAD(P)/FAD-dependent oxidoreductase [Candidatus Omnitrophica bacterium]|nr:NAD(P)/FAD-dependent oxidoreductase [Candidatus Omnitrophota bacterium]
MSDYLIIGNSAGAIGAIRGIRQVDKKKTITVISKEPYLAYSRPALAHYLCGEISEENMYYCNGEFYSKNNVKLELGKKITKILPKDKKALAETGETFKYSKLLLASGGTPIQPEIKGSDKEGVCAFVEWDDVKTMDKKLPNVKNALVLGGGLIGLNAAYGLRKRGVGVTIVELAERLLSPVLDNLASELVKQRFKAEGVNVLTGVTIEEVLGKDGIVEKIKLTNGKSVNCDLLVVAVGVRPGLSLLEGSGIETGRGVLVNEYMQTNIADIYAAGDITESYDILHGKRRVSPLWPNATAQGCCAGLNMAGKVSVYPGNMDLNSLQFYGLDIMTAGFANAEGNDFEVQKLFKEKDNIYKRLVFKGNNLVGAILVHNVDRAGIYTNIIKQKEDVSSFKNALMNDNFGLISLPAAILKSWEARTY